MSPHDFVAAEIFSEMERMLAGDSDFCGCTKCKADVAAFALCQLPAIYSEYPVEVSLDADVGNPVLHATVVVSVQEALTAVKAQPRH